jgi:hypothetical protein
MVQSSKYYRARLIVIEELLSTVDVLHDDRERKILQNGVFPERFNESKLVQQKQKERSFSNTKLSFDELTRFNTWFAMHSEKIAGVEKFTSSREFPITIKGSKVDIHNAINPNHGNFQLKLKMQRSKAKLKLLKL